MIILLAGAGGQLGRDLQDVLAGPGLRPFDHHQLDITDPAAVADAVERTRPAWVINSAAFNDVDAAERAPDQAFAVNASGAGNLAQAATRVGAALLHVSTDYVFDGEKGSPYTEADNPHPLSVYGRSKLEGEWRVLESGASACIVRTAWLYGRHGNNFVKAIQAAAQRGGPLRVVADQLGSPTATRDLAEAIAALIRRNSPPPLAGEGQGGGGSSWGLFHVVNTGACSRFEFARAIVGDSVAVQPISTAEAGRLARRPKDSALISERWAATGLPALASWQDALQRFLTGKQAPSH